MARDNGGLQEAGDPQVHRDVCHSNRHFLAAPVQPGAAIGALAPLPMPVARTNISSDACLVPQLTCMGEDLQEMKWSTCQGLQRFCIHDGGLDNYDFLRFGLPATLQQLEFPTNSTTAELVQEELKWLQRFTQLHTLRM
eukprot:2599773-Rhodomonas_salina.1